MSKSSYTYNEIPVVAVYRDGPILRGGYNQFYGTFFCSHCRAWHCHGVDDEELIWPGSHRAAHCFKKLSPLRDKGYFIWLIDDLPAWAYRQDGAKRKNLTDIEIFCLSRPLNTRTRSRIRKLMLSA